MRQLLRLSAVGVLLGVAFPAMAQQAASPSTDQSTAPPSTSETRPATNTFLGDTGLWFVPTGEVLPAKRMSGGGYYVNQDFTEAFMDVADFSGVAAYRASGTKPRSSARSSSTGGSIPTAVRFRRLARRSAIPIPSRGGRRASAIFMSAPSTASCRRAIRSRSRPLFEAS